MSTIVDTIYRLSLGLPKKTRETMNANAVRMSRRNKAALLFGIEPLYLWREVQAIRD
jgi:hypothetical protein